MTVFANDTSNNINNTERVFFTIDTVAPLVIFTQPNNNSNYSIATNNVTFTVRGNDTTLTIQNILLSFDNASGTEFNVTAINLSGAWTVSYNVSSLAEGRHNVTIIANDTIGNLNVTGTLLFTVDFTGPSVRIDTRNGSNFSYNFQQFNATVLDALLAVDSVVFNFSNATGTAFNRTAINMSGNWSLDLNVTSLVEGLQRMTVIANDSVDNYNRTAFIEFTVDRTAPNVRFTAPNNGSLYGLNTITLSNQTINAVVNDSLLTIASLLFSFDNASGTEFNVTSINTSGVKNPT